MSLNFSPYNLTRKGANILKKNDSWNRSRGWLLTLSADKYTEEDIKNILENKKYTYVVYQKEKGNKEDYVHYQMYIENDNALRFESLKNVFTMAHIESRLGTKKQAFEYCTKENTRIGKIVEYGIRPNFDLQELKISKLEEFTSMIKEGCTDNELAEFDIKLYSKFYNSFIPFIRNRTYIDNRQKYIKKEVIYIWGKAGLGKTRYVYDNYDMKEIYKVSSYGVGRYDQYNGEKVLLLDDFRSSIAVEEFLQLLDGYLYILPCRYNNKALQANIIIITSNISWYNQYWQIRSIDVELNNALNRRITKCIYIETEKNIKDLKYLLK